MTPHAASTATAVTDAPSRPVEPSRVAYELWDNLTRVIKGKNDTIRHVVVALLSGGHLLVEDVPGVGKTLLAKSLAQSMGGLSSRIQGTHDLMPSELTGVSIHQSGEWRFHPGPLFSNVVVLDEVNRCTPRTQAALLEAMEERQVSVDGVTRPLPQPFFVVATQNPHEHAGTFPLVEGQRDRFTLVARMGYPDRDSERSLLLGQGGDAAFADLAPVTSPEAVAAATAATRRLHCSTSVADYILDVATATRVHPDVALGASPRAALALLHASQAHAVLSHRTYVSPADVQALAVPVLAHRLILHGGPDVVGSTQVVAALLEQLPVPRE